MTVVRPKDVRFFPLLLLAIAAPVNPHAYANTDPDDDGIVAPPSPRADCKGDLTREGIRFRDASIPVHTEGKKRKITCGAGEVVTYLGGPAKIRYSSVPTLTCTMALALARFETVAQEEALRTMKKRIVKIDHLGTYSCREMAAYPGWVSEHSYANAIDIESFTLENGTVVPIARFFEKTDVAPTNPKADFLRTLSHRLYDEDLFSTVLTSFFDARHRNHFHLDMARYRTDGSRPVSL